MNTLPTIRSYGEYASSNYGANCLEVSFSNGFTLYYSYSTIVAFRKDYHSPTIVRQNDWSTTTGKHLNWIDGGDKTAKRDRLESEQFEKALTDVLTEYNLILADTAREAYQAGYNG